MTMSFYINQTTEEAMEFKNFRKSCICLFSFFVFASLPLNCPAESGKASPAEPVATSAKNKKVRATEPVTVVSIIRQPEGYSSDGPNAINRATDPVTTMYAIPERVRPSTEPVTTKTRTR
jgi:hypothetical protein